MSSSAVFFFLPKQCETFRLSYPDLDAGPGGGAEPVAVGAEAERVDGVATPVEGVEVLALVEVPQHRLPVLAPRGAQRPVRRHRDRVEEARVAVVVRLQLAVGQVPHLRHATQDALSHQDVL